MTADGRLIRASISNQQWEADPGVLKMSMLEHLRWSWLDWKFYSIPQVSIRTGTPSSSLAGRGV